LRAGKNVARKDLTMRKILVAGNWKMHGSKAMVRDLLEGLLSGSSVNGNADLAVFPSFPYLSMTESMLSDSHIRFGGQTLNPNIKGAHTGETSGSMLVDMGCHYVLVGHSERRAIYAESDADVAKRFKTALEAGLEPVLCVGETQEEREASQTEAVVSRQLDAVLELVGIDAFSRATIAYEPVWAIGTGLTASPDQAQSVHAFIRDKLSSLNVIIGSQIQILYGGSVKGSNAAELFAQSDIDGGLVGGASLTAEDFLAIYNAVA
jgi:triosephosphate isomerase